MVHAAKEGKLKNPSPEVKKAAGSMTDKSAKDFASTSTKGLPSKIKSRTGGKRVKRTYKK